MKTFQQFNEQVKEFDPKKFTSGVVNTLINKMDTKKIKIPTSDEMSSKVGELSTKLQTKLNDPSFQKKYEKGINFLKTFGKQVPTK